MNEQKQTRNKRQIARLYDAKSETPKVRKQNEIARKILASNALTGSSERAAALAHISAYTEIPPELQRAIMETLAFLIDIEQQTE